MWRQFLIAIILCAMIAFALYWIPNPYPNLIFKPNEEIRAAIDIGSGTTNLKVAKVNTQTNKIISKIYEQTIPVGYQSQLEHSGNNTFNQEVMNQGIQSIQTLKDAALMHQAKRVVGVATAAFRTAANGVEFANEIEKQTGVPVRVVDQDEEGILAFRGALALTAVQPEDAVVWDIGGGSMQLTTLSSQGTYLVEKGTLASIPFRNYIIQAIEKHDIKTVPTPNPMNQEVMDAAVTYAKQNSLLTNDFVKNKIAMKGTHVLGVGNLLNRGVQPLVGKDIIDQSELGKAVNGLVGKTDADLPEGHPDVIVSNAALIYGYMLGLDMKELHFVQVNNADGALTYAPYWDEGKG